MYRIFLRYLCLLIVIFSLISCSKNIDEVTTVTLSGWQSSPIEKQLIEKVLKNFEAKYPNIEVKFEVIVDRYMDTIKTRLIGDAAPDVFYLDASEAPLLMSYDVLEPLNQYLSSNLNLADFETSLLKAFQYKGNIYGLPKDFSTLALFYNTSLFKQANLNNPPKTWQELQDYSQKLTIDRAFDRQKKQYGLGITPELARQYFILKAFGGKLFDCATRSAKGDRNGYVNFATTKNLKGLQNLVDRYQKDRSVVLPSDVGASSGSEMFGRGKVAMAIEGSWAIPYLKDTFPNLKFATTQIPSINGKQGTMAYTVAYVMNKKTKNKDAAWKLISYLTGKEGMKIWGKAGLVIPSRKSIISNLGYLQNPLYAPFIKGITHATIWQAGRNLPIISTHFNNQFISALLGEQSLQSAMQKAQDSANHDIRSSNY
jgi:multiple sugar transport system substrate-binding protein